MCDLARAVGVSDREAGGEGRERIRAALAARSDGVLEVIARELGVSTLSVLEATPAQERFGVPADHFEEIWRDITEWGQILFIVHTPDIVVECSGSLPSGAHSQGYYNLNGASPIHGHIKVDNCRAIFFVDRRFHGRRSCSVQFFNVAGEPMFKIFVGRDVSRELIPTQLARFEDLWRRMKNAAAELAGAPV